MFRVSLVFGFFGIVYASPFELTDNYIKQFESGIEQLKKLAEEHVLVEKNFDFEHNKEPIPDETEYDFIIVGAGAAGSVIANRLTEKPEWKVLLLEAGGPETEITKIPHYYHLLQNTDYNWNFKTVPQKHWCHGMIDNCGAIAAGKALGGSTAINGMLYTRGNAKDYDLWADLGNDGWCYNDVLPYFKKAEDANLETFDHKYHNRGGPFYIEHPQYTTQLTNDTLHAAHELALDVVDFNGKEQLGIGSAQISTKHGKRHSTSTAYLEPARKRSNLILKPFSHVTKVLIAPHTKEAKGVLYLHEGKLQSANAKREVILSAGTFNSPQILMLSGIGPKEELERLEIPIIKDLSVGKYLKDHIGFIGLDFIEHNNDTVADDNNDSSKTDNLINYLKYGKGKLTTNGIETIAFIQTEVSKDDTKHPDIELYFKSKIISSESKFNPFLLKKEIFTSLWEPNKGKQGLGIGVLLAHPKSTGSLTLKDKDPLHQPLIDPNQLSDPDDEDINTLLHGIKFAIKFAHTEALKKRNLEINNHPVAGCEEHKWGTDDYWKCAIRHLTVSLRHQTGTVRMGPKTDQHAVVDNNLKVYGIQKLRVADASVIPVTITGHTMAPAIMIGEKASDLIKETWH